MSGLSFRVPGEGPPLACLALASERAGRSDVRTGAGPRLPARGEAACGSGLTGWLSVPLCVQLRVQR